MNSYTSIYIPRMATYHTEISIKNIMCSFRIGNVVRVDFTQINKKPGFGENVDDVVMSAFVHFSGPLGFDNSTLENIDFWNTISSDQPYRLYINSNEYWICLRNKNPVQYTKMNIHQIVENGRHLENLIKEQQTVIDNLTKKLERTDSIVYQLLGGLFNKSTQSEALGYHLAILGENLEFNGMMNYDTSKWGSWPTTRQGDECEKKITELEHIIGDMMNNKKNNTIDCDNDSIITNPSISDLIEVDSVCYFS